MEDISYKILDSLKKSSIFKGIEKKEIISSIKNTVYRLVYYGKVKL